MLTALQRLPPAIIAAREDEALTHGQVMYGLIKPTKDMSQIESTAAMVNVIPKKRIYRMENPEEIDLFMEELQKRPLVLQPSAFIGRGFSAIRCSFYTKEERWVVLINQVHPKIYSRIRLGIDTAKAKMARGEPFVLEMSFDKFLKRVYFDRLTKAVLDPRFTFIDFEHAEIMIRYPGDRFHKGMQWEFKSENKIRFEFEDLLPSDIQRRTVMGAQGEWSNPALRVIMPDELQTFLPGWNFEDIDPLAGVTSEGEEEDDEIENGAVGGDEMPLHEVEPSAPPLGKIVGRARRKANQAGEKVTVPVELHAPEPNKPQMLYPSYQHRDSSMSPDHNYEKLNRQTGVPENPYGNMTVQNVSAPHSPRMGGTTGSSAYETTNTSGQYGQRLSPYGPPSPRSPRTPMSQGIPGSPRTAMSPRTPTTPHTPVSTYSQQSPYMAGSRSPASWGPVQRADRYNTEQVNTRQMQQTYLTDDDDGGFSTRSPKSPQPNHGKMYDSNFNKPGLDRYGDHIKHDPRDRYADQQPGQRIASSNRRPEELYRSSPSWNGPQMNADRSGPVPAPRGFHRHQGSGRSDTSASDSGFGETENGVESSTYRADRSSGIGVNDMKLSKTPYYNRGFEQDSPEQDRAVVDDIMAKHKAMAAKLYKQQGHSVPGKQEFYSDSNYNRELQKWRQNINDLEQSCDAPEVDFSRTRLRVNSQEEPMEESFI